MSAITQPLSKHRADAHRLFAPGEQRRLNIELGAFKGAPSVHWRLLAKLAIETGATPSDLANAAWCNFDEMFRVWTIPVSRQGRRHEPKPVVMTRKGSRIMRILSMFADSQSDRVFHSLPTSALGLSISFGYAASRAGLINFTMKDFLSIAIAKRVAAFPNVRVEEIVWAMGIRHMQPARNTRAYRRKDAQPHQPWTNSTRRHA